MKIAIDARSLMDKKYSGVARFSLNLIQALLKLDRENEYYFFYNTFSDPESVSRLDFKSSRANIRVRRIPNKLLNYLLLTLLRWPNMSLLLGVKPDVFYMPHLNFAIFDKQSRNYLTIHDLSFKRFPEFFSRRKNIWHSLLPLGRLTKRADKVIAISESTKQDIMDIYNLPADKVKVVYSGVGPEFAPVEDAAELGKLRIKYDLPEKFILYLGNIEPRKNIDGLIQAYELMRRKYPEISHSLVIAGNKGWKYRAVFARARASVYAADIKFSGYITEQDKPALYSLASLFVFPSFYEGFGFPPLEAQACGTPVVASYAASLPEILDDSAVLINPYDVNDLSEAMAEVLNDFGLRESLRQEGLLNVRRFDWQKTAAEYLRVFEN